MKTKLLIVASLVTVIALPACQNLQTALNSTTAHEIEQNVAPLVAGYAATGKVNEAQAINVGLQSIADLAPATWQQAGVSQFSDLIRNTVAAFTGDKGSGTTLGQRIAQAVVTALPSNPTPVQVKAAVVTAGVTASTAANAPVPAATPAPVGELLSQSQVTSEVKFGYSAYPNPNSDPTNPARNRQIAQVLH
jgi:hypothetical protein